MALGAQLDKILRSDHLTLAQVSRETGISKSTLYRMRRQDSMAMQGAHLIALANYLNVPVDYFFENGDPRVAEPSSDSGIQISDPMPPYTLPLGCALEDVTSNVVGELSATCLAVRVLDESMSPDFRPGDMAIVRLSENVVIGCTGLFEYDGEAVLRVLGNGFLLPLNPLFPPSPIRLQCVSVGAVVGKATA